MAKVFVINLDEEVYEKFQKILENENLTESEWLSNAIEDYDS
jgi:metal-responsive CopG/Arc/MetJ family transcriptional regulator